MAEVIVMFSVSVPAPPSITSPELRIVAATPVVGFAAGAEKVSSASVPLMLSTPVVSDLVGG